MAVNLSVEPMICLKWDTLRPYYVGASRQSPDFDILQNKWYLELKITQTVSEKYDYYCEIWLKPRLSPSPSNYLLKVDCELRFRCKSFSQSENIRNYTTSICLLKKSISYQEIASSGVWEETWYVTCTFRDTNTACSSFSFQVGNKTVYVSSGKKNSPLTSVDECVQVSSEIPHDIEALSSDISGLYKEEILPDFKLECGGRSFPVHRSVLAARSEVFRAMFRNRMLESETGSADIKDLEVPVLESFLEFLYSGKLKDLTDVSASNLYEAADKYDVHSLRAACSYWMVRNLTEDNCVSYLSIADSHSDADLKAAAMTFILDRPRVFKSSAWIKFSENHIKEAFEVLQAYAASTIQRSSDDE